MKGSEAMIDALNSVLTVELTAINQYYLHSKICAHMGLAGLGKIIRKESIEEMMHADKLIDRILFLEGRAEIARYGTIRVGHQVPEMFEHDLALEMQGLNGLKAAIAISIQTNDHVSRELLEEILVDSEAHVDWLETQISLIEQVGVQNYLAEHIKEA